MLLYGAGDRVDQEGHSGDSNKRPQGVPGPPDLHSQQRLHTLSNRPAGWSVLASWLCVSSWMVSCCVSLCSEVLHVYLSFPGEGSQSDVPFRENFARVCFEALLQFSFVNTGDSPMSESVCTVYTISVYTCRQLLMLVILITCVSYMYLCSVN